MQRGVAPAAQARRPGQREFGHLAEISGHEYLFGQNRHDEFPRRVSARRQTDEPCRATAQPPSMNASANDMTTRAVVLLHHAASERGRNRGGKQFASARDGSSSSASMPLRSAACEGRGGTREKRRRLEMSKFVTTAFRVAIVLRSALEGAAWEMGRDRGRLARPWRSDHRRMDPDVRHHGLARRSA